MTLSEILTNEELRCHEFPVVRKKVFLAHAGVSCLPRRVVEAMGNYATAAMLQDQEETVLARELIRYRQSAARLIGAEPDEVAFVGPTSLALSLVAGGLDWRAGDEVVLYFDDYPSNVYPWTALAEKGVRMRFVQAAQLGRITQESVLEQVTERTKLVALASCHFVAGYRIDLHGLGRALKERNVLFCVDAIQTVGAFPTPAENCDFLAADAHKWMLGPCAAGIFYVRGALQASLRPCLYGWHNVRCPNFVAQREIILKPGAARYEVGTHNVLGLVGMNAALELLLEIGLETIAGELLRKRTWLIHELLAKGYRVLQSDAPPSNASAIVSFYKPETDLPALHERLTNRGIVLSLRTDRTGQRYLRAAPHFYNTDAELQRLIDLL